MTVTGYFNGGTTFAAKIVTSNSYSVTSTARGITANGVVVAAAGGGGCSYLNGSCRNVQAASIGASGYGASDTYPTDCNGRGVWGGKGTCEPSAYTCQNGTASADIKLTRFTFQISLAYSAIVRSLENLPILATFKIAFFIHSSLLTKSRLILS